MSGHKPVPPSPEPATVAPQEDKTTPKKEATATPPPSPPPSNRHYQPRAFGLEWKDLFIEGTLFVEESAPQMLNAEGRFAPEDDGKEETGTWVEYSSLNDLQGKAGWDGEAMGGFVNRLRAMLSRA